MRALERIRVGALFAAAVAHSGVNNNGNPCQFAPLPARRAAYSGAVASSRFPSLDRSRRPRDRLRLALAWLVLSLAVFGLLAAAGTARGAEPSAALEAGATIAQQARQFVAASGGLPGKRLEVEVGALDPRLKLAPCDRIEPYLPSGVHLWGRTRIGLRCTQGATPWNVYLPLTVKVFGPAVTSAAALPAGAVLTAADLRTAEVDLAARGTAIVDPDAAIGRTLARPLAPGQSLRAADLRKRQWFAAGETVQITAIGPGFRVSGEGQALGPGYEGQSARVRTESGRIVVGQPVAERRIEIAL